MGSGRGVGEVLQDDDLTRSFAPRGLIAGRRVTSGELKLVCRWRPVQQKQRMEIEVEEEGRSDDNRPDRRRAMLTGIPVDATSAVRKKTRGSEEASRGERWTGRQVEPVPLRTADISEFPSSFFSLPSRASRLISGGGRGARGEEGELQSLSPSVSHAPSRGVTHASHQPGPGVVGDGSNFGPACQWLAAGELAKALRLELSWQFQSGA